MQAVSLLLLSPDGFVCGSHGQIYEEILKYLKNEKEFFEDCGEKDVLIWLKPSAAHVNHYPVRDKIEIPPSGEGGRGGGCSWGGVSARRPIFRKLRDVLLCSFEF
jgi:hypothetical protein